MSREEAIELLDNLIGMVEDNHNSDYDTAFKMAIKALEQEPSGETVSLEAFKQVMWERDIAIEQLKELGYGFGQKIESSGDVISRQATIEAFQIFRGYEANRTNAEWVDRIETVVEKLPSVKQEPKTGHWKVVSDGYGDNAYICECSECKDTVWVYKNADRKWNYCPNCGCRMVEPQESEDKK